MDSKTRNFRPNFAYITDPPSRLHRIVAGPGVLWLVNYMLNESAAAWNTEQFVFSGA
jgi:hypothetical protein